jgi:hypothetical protein
MQVALLAYGSIIGRFAVFSALRASATATGSAIEQVAINAAGKIVSSAPGLSMAGAACRETPLPLRGAVLAARRLTLTILVKVPRVIPSRRLIPLDTVCASGAMPMEPAR